MTSGEFAHGGKTIFGATVGILMLEARFPRIPGDMGNALTWPFPVQFRMVRGASPAKVVLRRADGLLQPFIDAARDLVDHGCDGITTTCGFLSIFQNQLSEAVGVPVATSSLMQIPMVERLLPPGRRVGVLTVSEKSLEAAHLTSAGVSPDIAVVGTDSVGDSFSGAILENRLDMDIAGARRDLLAAADKLLKRQPETGAIVLECTNMTPYAADIRQKTGLPVYSIRSFVTWFQSGLMPVRFPAELDDPRS